MFLDTNVNKGMGSPGRCNLPNIEMTTEKQSYHIVAREKPTTKYNVQRLSRQPLVQNFVWTE